MPINKGLVLESDFARQTHREPRNATRNRNLMRSSCKYFDVDDILAGEERIHCTFTTDALGCGFLDPSCPSDTLPKTSQVELPLWLVSPLVTRGDIVVQIPVFLTERFRRMIKAGASSLNLREFCVFFDQIAKQMHQLVMVQANTSGISRTDAEASALVMEEIVRFVFGGERFRQLLNHCMVSLEEDNTEFIRRLCSEERKLFDVGQQDAKGFIQWKARHCETIHMAPIMEKKKHLSQQQQSSSAPQAHKKQRVG